MSAKLTVFLYPLDFTACVNSSTGLGQALIERGHRVVMALGEAWKGKLSKYGFEELYYKHLPSEVEVVDPQMQHAENIQKMAATTKAGPLAIYLEQYEKEWEPTLEDFKFVDKQLKSLLDDVDPDVIVYDGLISSPAIETYGKPWIFVWTAQPLDLYQHTGKVPPTRFGLPVNDRSEWAKYEDVVRRVAPPQIEKFNKWLVECGARPLESDKRCLFAMPSPHGNFYMYPKELDYSEEAGELKEWHQFDSFVRRVDDTFEIPEKLKDKSGKLIYLSMGSMGCCDVELMKRLVAELVSSPHRFIVSKGPFADQYELPENMWGEQYVPQTKVLEVVDLFITHGGNNSTTEGIICGKPMIVLPLFCDQPDNAQRVAEKGFGYRFKPYEVTGKELNEAIEKLLNNKELPERLKKVKERVRAANNQTEAGKLIEIIVSNHTSKQ